MEKIELENEEGRVWVGYDENAGGFFLGLLENERVFGVATINVSPADLRTFALSILSALEEQKEEQKNEQP